MPARVCFLSKILIRCSLLVLLTVCTLLFSILNRSSRWWSVFWVLFQAKSNPLGSATDDALTYTQVRDLTSPFPFSTNRSLIYSIKRARLLCGCSPPNQLHQEQMSLPFILVIPQFLRRIESKILSRSTNCDASQDDEWNTAAS